MAEDSPFPFVYRFNAPAGFKGRRCRILSQGGRNFDRRTGQLIPNTCDNRCLLEFENGDRLEAIRSAFVRSKTRLAKQAQVRASVPKRWVRRKCDQCGKCLAGRGVPCGPRHILLAKTITPWKSRARKESPCP